MLRVLCLVLAAFLWIPAIPARADDGLVMGLVTTDAPKTLLATWQPLFEDMSKSLGTPVHGAVAGDYAGIIWYLASNKAQLAWVGNKAAIEAVDRTDSEVLAQVLTLYGAGYRAHLIVRKDSGLDTLDAVLKNGTALTFGNGDPNSTSRNLVPSYYVFATRGLSSETVFKRMLHQSHEENFHAVASGKVDVATSNSSALARYKVRFPEEFSQIKVIWTSPMIPSDPIVVRSTMKPELKHRILEFLVQYGKPAEGKSEAQLKREKSMLATRRWTGFQASDDSQLTPVRRLELFKEKLALKRNGTLPEADRKARIKAIDAELEQLDRSPSLQ